MENKNKGTGYFGILSILLGVAFIVLQLTEVIVWSWVWVLSPIWIYVSLYFVGSVLAALFKAAADE